MLYDQIALGDSASSEKTITEEDVYLFAGIVGNFNPIHISKSYAEKSRFGQRIAHGLLVGGLFSGLLATKLPGEGAVYLSQEISFRAPVYFGDTVKTTVTVTDKLEKGKVRLDCTATNQRGETVITGAALALVSNKGEKQDNG